jgi:lysophospholipase L1-like esterase
MRRVSQEPLRILIFGQSNTHGVQLGEGEAAWPSIVASALPELTGKPVEITVRPFFAHAPGSDAYLEREVRQREPDIVFLMLTTFSFANRVIEPGVRRRFGERAGNAYSALARRFDAATRGRGRLAERLNESGRALALRVFPAEAVTTYEIALEGTTKALQLLARQEHLQVVAVHGFVKLPKRRNGRPSQKEVVVERFLSEVRALTGRLHITFINLQRDTVPESWYMPDGLHVSGEAHKAIAAAVLGAFEDGRMRG